MHAQQQLQLFAGDRVESGKSRPCFEPSEPERGLTTELRSGSVSLAIEQAGARVARAMAADGHSSIPALLQVVAQEARALSGVAAVCIELDGVSGCVDQSDEALVIGKLSGMVPHHVPLDFGGRRLGQLTAFRLASPVEPKHCEKGILAAFAERVAPLLNMALLHHQQAREHARLSLLERVRAELAPCFDVASTLPTLRGIARLVVPNLADCCAIYLVAQDDELKPVALAHRDPLAEPLVARMQAQARVRRAYERNLLAQVLARPTTHLVRCEAGAVHCCDLDKATHDLALTVGLRSVIVVPLMRGVGASHRASRHARQRVAGLMCFGLASDQRRYDDTHVAWAEAIAARCAVALDTAALVEDLERAVEARDSLLAVVSHDLKNPLNAISLTARALAPESLATERRKSRKQLELIKRSAAHMTHLVDDLLLAANIESGQLAVTPASTAAHELVSDVCHLMEPLVASKSIALVQGVADVGPPVLADRGRVLQVLCNLIENAVKFTPRGGTVRVELQHGPGWGRFSVTDSGPGIAVHLLPRLFERYFKGNSAHEGLGLGLFIARGIVEAHGGSIRVDSHPGAGTTISFTIPAQP